MAGIAQRVGGNPLAALFLAAGERPDASRIDELARSGDDFSISHRGKDPANWVELLRDGLTFDLIGLSPEESCAVEIDQVRLLGLPADVNLAMLEPVCLAAGPHLAGAEHLLPIVRGAAQLLTSLSQKLAVKAVLWTPSGAAVSPEWFAKACNAWIAGGPFPAFAMTSFVRTSSDMTSRGLAFLIGQEFKLYSSSGILQEEDVRVSVRLVDWLVAHGKVERPREVVLPGVGAVRLEPGADGLIHARSV